MAPRFLNEIDLINKTACANGALALALDAGTVSDLGMHRRQIQDNAPQRPDTGDIYRCKYGEKLQ